MGVIHTNRTNQEYGLVWSVLAMKEIYTLLLIQRGLIDWGGGTTIDWPTIEYSCRSRDPTVPQNADMTWRRGERAVRYGTVQKKRSWVELSWVEGRKEGRKEGHRWGNMRKCGTSMSYIIYLSIYRSIYLSIYLYLFLQPFPAVMPIEHAESTEPIWLATFKEREV